MKNNIEKIKSLVTTTSREIEFQKNIILLNSWNQELRDLNKVTNEAIIATERLSKALERADLRSGKERQSLNH